jgi:Domain of unknown function (DUF4124)
MMKPPHLRVLALTTALGLSLAAGSGLAQQMYQWTDENGVVHYSDSPPPQGVTATEGTLPEAAPPTSDNPYKDIANQPSAAQQKRADMAQKSQEARAAKESTKAQCSAWQEEVDRLEPNRRVFYTNEAGETERMDDVERTKRVAELKSQIASNCR